MKRGTPDHWKMRELARLMKIPVRYALPWANGTMERMWHYTAKYHPRGDIGSTPDTHIAHACGWPESDAKSLIDALVAAKWLDRDQTYRLLVHDWPEHCDNAVKKTLKNNNLSFCFLEKFSSGAGKVFLPGEKSMPCLSLKPLPIPLAYPSGVGNTYDPIPGWQWFLSVYPSGKINPVMDCRLWMGIVESPEIEDKIRDHLPKAKSSEQWTKDNGRFIPSAESYLSKRKFLMAAGPSAEVEETKEQYRKRMGLS